MISRLLSPPLTPSRRAVYQSLQAWIAHQRKILSYHLIGLKEENATSGITPQVCEHTRSFFLFIYLCVICADRRHLPAAKK